MATYYIAAAGSTSNSGTSPASPWPLSKVSSATFVAGDMILFNKGDTFSGTINFTKSGALGNPITFDCYGTSTHNPIIDGAGSSTASVLQLSGSYIAVNNLTLQNNTYNQGIIKIGSGIHDINIYNCFINKGIRGINAVSSGSGGVANIKVFNCWFTNIADTINPTTGDHANGGGSHIQLNNVNGSGVELAYNNSYSDGAVTNLLGVGDQYSLYQSNGTASSYMLVHDNNIQGGSTQTNGYDGIGLGDVGGSYQKAYNNVMSNPGCAGIQMVGGSYIISDNNKIYGPGGGQWCFQGITLGNFGGATTPVAGSWTCTNNKVNFINKYGNKYSWFVSSSTGTPTVDMSTNTPQLSFDPTITAALLPNPLWTGTPWDTTAGNVYYISNSGVNTNVGLSPNSPWPVSMLSTYQFQPGSKIVFNKGETFGTFTFTRSGTAGNPIVFDLYGTATNNAIIDAGNTATPCVTVTNAAYLTFNNLQFTNSQSYNGNMYFNGTGTHDITIFNCHISGAYRGINMVNCTSNLVIKNCYLEQFRSPVINNQPSNGAGSAIQLNNCNGSGIEVAYNKCYTPVTLNDPNTANLGIGDVISIYQCYGTSASYILVHDNQVRGGGSSQPGYAGLVLGDVGGQYQYGYNNIFVNSGKVGAQVQGGTYINMSNNLIYGGSLPYTSVGLAFGNYYTISGVRQPCNNITIGSNKICFYSASNSGTYNKWYDTGSGVTIPTNWSTNTADNTCDAGAYDGLLTNPLWTGSPWNTVTGLLFFRGQHLIQL